VSGYSVDIAALAGLVTRMQRFQAQLTAARDDVERRVADLHPVWTGEAALAHAAAHRSWDTAAAQTQEALATLRSIASTAHANYLAASAANRRMWSL
jgi:WXG100 family type VII secretion target